MENVSVDHGAIISALLNARNTAHVLHLNTKSFAMHMALNSLYDSLGDDLDRLAENFKGYLGANFIVPVNQQECFNTESELAFVYSLAAYCETQRKNMQTAYDSFYSNSECGETVCITVPVSPSALAIMDDILKSVLSAVYKISQLK